MDLVGGYPFWLIKNGLLFSYPALERSLQTDVLIMGGGISGALVAYHLVNAGVNCVIVDSRSIGLGSTCANTSLLQYEVDVPLSILKNKIGSKKAVMAYQLCEEAIWKIGKIDNVINCGEFEPKKSLYYAATKKDVKFIVTEFKTRQQNGFEVSLLDEAMINSRFGFSAPAAILSGSAAQTDTYKFTHALLQYAIKKGLQVYDRTTIADIAYRHNGVLLTTVHGFKIKAKKLVYANGYEAVNYIPKKIVDLHSTYATVSEQFTGNAKLWEDEVLMWNTADPYLYMRTTKDRRIIVGGRDEPFRDPAKRDALICTKSKQLKNDLEKLFPGFKFKPEFSWTGTFGATKDGLPYIGSMENKPHSYFALGFGGNGIVFSLVAAEIITELVTKGRSKLKDLFSFARM